METDDIDILQQPLQPPPPQAPQSHHHYKKRYYYRSRQAPPAAPPAHRIAATTETPTRKTFHRNYHQFYANHRPIICSNCNGKGHFFKDCKKPIQSYGVLAWTLRSKLRTLTGPPDLPLITPPITSEYIQTMRALYATDQYELVVCLIRRRHTIGFEAFVRGKYNNSEELAIHRDRMTVDERKLIETCTWDQLYTQVMAEKDLRYMQREKRRAKALYEQIDVPAFLRSAVTEYNEPSWEFPKGRRFAHEHDQDCALREFEEETNIPIKDVLIVPADPDHYLREEFCGTNQKMYRNKYYVALVHPDTEGPFLDHTNTNQTSEVGAVRWFSFDEAMNVMRPFFHEKKRVLQESHQEIVELLTSNNPVNGRNGLDKHQWEGSSRKRKEPDVDDNVAATECLFTDSDDGSTPVVAEKCDSDSDSDSNASDRSDSDSNASERSDSDSNPELKF